MKNILKNVRECMRLRSLPVSIAGVLAATTTNIASGHCNLPVTFIFLLAVMCVQIMANLTECYFYLKDNAKFQRAFDNDHSEYLAGSTLQMYLRIVFNLLAFICITLGFTLIVIGDYWIILLGLFAALCIYVSSGSKKPLGATPWGALICFLCFGPVVVLSCYMLNEKHCDNTVLTANNLENMFGLASMVGFMAVNTFLVYVYTHSETSMNLGRPTMAMRRKKTRILWYYFADSVIVTGLGFILVLGSRFIQAPTIPLVFTALLFGIYMYIWLKLPSANTTHKSQTLQNLSMWAMMIYFLLMMIWMMIGEGKDLQTYFF